MEIAGEKTLASDGGATTFGRAKERAARAGVRALSATSTSGSKIFRSSATAGSKAFRSSAAAGSLAARFTGRAAVISATKIASVRKWRPSRSTVALILLAVFVVLASTWLLVRNSSLVAVQQVRVVGLDGHYDQGARKAVVTEAKQMTTMNVSKDDLTAAVSQFLDVADLRVDADYPHKLTVYVDVHRPVAAVKAGGRIVAVTADGLVLESTRGLSALPVVDADGLIRDDRVSGEKTAQALTVLGAAPDVLLRRVKSVEWQKRGLVLILEKGVKLRFGDAEKAAAKWKAVAAVLAAAESKGLSYIDVRIPERPAIGGLGEAPVTQKPALEESLQHDPAANAGSTVQPGATGATGQAPAVQVPATTAPAQPTTQQVPATGAPGVPTTP